MIQRPIELQRLVHKRMLIDTTAMRVADLQRIVCACGVHDHDIVREAGK